MVRMYVEGNVNSKSVGIDINWAMSENMTKNVTILSCNLKQLKKPSIFLILICLVDQNTLLISNESIVYL